MGSLLLPDLRVDSRRGLPPGKAGRVELSGDSDGPSETNVRHGGGGRGRAGRFGRSGDATPPPVFEPTFAPRLPARKAPFPVTASTQRPPTPSAPAEEGSARVPPL